MNGTYIKSTILNREKYTLLLNKFVDGKTNAEENDLLFKHYQSLQKENAGWNEDEMGDQELTGARILAKIVERMDHQDQKVKTFKFNWYWSVAAAIVILCLGLFLTQNQTQQLQGPPLAINPGGNRATLVLDNGKRITLLASEKGQIAAESGVSITKTNDGKLVYNVKQTPSLADIEKPVYHTIEVPKGGEYQVNLADGTKVWLNASSSLRFPVAFVGNTRQVILIGEGYFEVAKNKNKPFIVTTDHQNITVLGTHFNVNAYADELETKTTLLEGSVRVYPTGSQFKTTTLNPGEQAVLNAQHLVVNKVDPKEAISWKNGYFLFDNEDIKIAMRKLARWYDVEVSFQGDFENIQFGGSFSRANTLQETLRILESTNKFKCIIEGRRVKIIK